MAKKRNLGFFGTGGQFTLIYREMRDSDAYRVLTPKQKLILNDMIRTYRKDSFGDKNYHKEGFEYVWEVCEEDVSESAFYRMRQRLVDLGFFDYPLEIQRMRAGVARLFRPSREWAGYKATPSESKVLAVRNKAKKTRIQDKQRRLAKFRASMGDDKNRSGVSERGRSDMLGRGRSRSVKTESTCSNEADPDPISGDSHMLERGRHSNTIPIAGSEVDYDELVAAVATENRQANLEAVWPGVKPDLSVLRSLINESSRREMSNTGA